MATITKAERSAWLAERRNGLGGSDIAKILGLSKWGSEVDVYLDKKGLAPEQAETEAMRLGTYLENYVAERFTEDTNLRCIDYKPMIHSDCLLGNLDRIVVEEHQSAADMLARLRAGDLSCVESILECKTATKIDDWQDEFGNDVVPEYYRSQIMHYMGLIPSCKRCYVAVYFTGLTKGFKFMIVERDDELIAKMQAFCREWWKRHIVEGEIPSPRTEKEVKMIFPSSKSASVLDISKLEEGSELRKKFGRYRKLIEEIEEFSSSREEEADSLKAEIVSRMGENEILADGDSVLATFKSGKDTVRDVVDWEAVARELGTVTPELVKKHTRQGVVVRKGSRSFKIKDATTPKKETRSRKAA